MADTINVKAHTRKKPDRIKNDPLRDLIEARKAILAARMKPREQWSSTGYHLPKIFHSLAEWIRKGGA